MRESDVRGQSEADDDSSSSDYNLDDVNMEDTFVPPVPPLSPRPNSSGTSSELHSRASHHAVS